MKALLSPYMGRGTRKNFELVPLGGRGDEFRAGDRREKRHETRQNKTKPNLYLLNALYPIVVSLRKFMPMILAHMNMINLLPLLVTLLCSFMLYVFSLVNRAAVTFISSAEDAFSRCCFSSCAIL